MSPTIDDAKLLEIVKEECDHLPQFLFDILPVLGFANREDETSFGIRVSLRLVFLTTFLEALIDTAPLPVDELRMVLEKSGLHMAVDESLQDVLEYLTSEYIPDDDEDDDEAEQSN